MGDWLACEASLENHNKELDNIKGVTRKVIFSISTLRILYLKNMFWFHAHTSREGRRFNIENLLLPKHWFQISWWPHFWRNKKWGLLHFGVSSSLLLKSVAGLPSSTASRTTPGLFQTTRPQEGSLTGSSTQVLFIPKRERPREKTERTPENVQRRKIFWVCVNFILKL